MKQLKKHPWNGGKKSYRNNKIYNINRYAEAVALKVEKREVFLEIMNKWNNI